VIELQGVRVEVAVPRAGAPAATRTLLDGVDLVLSERRIGVIGANGSGKSTLLRLLNGLVLPSAGRVVVDGLDTRQDGRKVRQRVGFVFTDPLAQLVMATPADDLELSLRRTIRDRTARRERARDLLAARGLADLADQSVYDLSGGERQLVALTSILATDPATIVADEPTTLLDLRNRELVRQALTSLDQQLVLATHDLEMAATMDRVVVIDDGRVVADGPAAASIASYVGLMAR